MLGSSRSSLRVLTIGPQGTTVRRFAIESKLPQSLFTQQPYVHVARPITPAPAAAAPPRRERRRRLAR